MKAFGVSFLYLLSALEPRRPNRSRAGVSAARPSNAIPAIAPESAPAAAPLQRPRLLVTDGVNPQPRSLVRPNGGRVTPGIRMQPNPACAAVPHVLQGHC
jgi:hypothetical protein